nr:hypothetical protein [Pandoravirus aubagnensis]
MAGASSDRSEVLKALSVALASLAKPSDDTYEHEREMSPTTPKEAAAICRHFAGIYAARTDWQSEVLRRATACDPRGVRLCLATMDAMHVSVHALSVIPARARPTTMPGLPRAYDTDESHDWYFADDNGNNENHGENDCYDDHYYDVNERDPAHDNDRSMDAVPQSAPGRGSKEMGSHSEDTQRPLPFHLVLSCSRLVNTCAGSDDGRPCDGTNVTKEARRFVFKVRIGFWPDVWMAAGPVVDAETGTCVDLACLLAARDVPDQIAQGDGPLVARRRLIDFLASGLHTWEAFAAQRYGDLRRLPEVLAAHGWRVDRSADAPWTWTCDAGPLAESYSRSLSLEHPDLPEKIYIHLDAGRLVVCADDTWLYDPPFTNGPCTLPADPIDSIFYGDAPGFPRDPCTGNGRHHWLSHIERDMCVQRVRLVGMGLVSECVLGGRTVEYIARQWDRQDERYLFRMRNTPARVLPPVGPDTTAQLIKDHVAQAIFGEYGPVETATGRRLNGGLCDDLLGAAIESGQLCLGLRCIDKIVAEAYECPIDCDLGAHSTMAFDRPRMLVNWRARCAAVVSAADGPERRTAVVHKEMHPVRVWAGIAVQTDGCGGACVALIVQHERSPLDESVGDPTADGATWRQVAERCTKGAPEHPPELHPALVASLETERACETAACVTPWAYHTGTDGPVDARVLTEWALDRIADLFKAIDDAATAVLDDARASAPAT